MSARVAAVDCGTNSIRLLIADVSDGRLTDVHREMRIVRLGQGVDATGEFHPDALARTMNDSLKDSPEVAKTLLTDRNARWATWIKERLAKPGTVFVAVGAGHLAGNDSVQAQLAKQGIKAERIVY